MSKKVVDNWFKVVNQADVAELLIFGYIGPYDEIDYISFQAAIATIKKNYTDVKLRIHCGGGSVFEGLPIYDCITTSGLNVTVEIEGLAASMGSVLSQAASPGKRGMRENATMMIHRVKGAQFGTFDDLRSYADMVEDGEKRIKAIFTNSTKQEASVVDGWFAKNTDLWINAETALDWGLIDYIIKDSTTVPPLPINKLKEMGEEQAFKALTNSLENLTQNSKTDMNKLQVLLMAGLAARGISVVENATEEQTAQTVTNAFKGLDDKITELENRIKTNNEAQADALVNKAEADGKIKADDAEGKKDLKDLALVNYAMASKMVDKMTGTATAPKNVVVNIGTTGGGSATDPKNDRSAWTYKEWSQKDVAGLQNMKTADPTNFAKLFEAEYGQKFEA